MILILHFQMRNSGRNSLTTDCFAQLYSVFLLFRVVEVHRTCEATATPSADARRHAAKEGASLSEIRTRYFEQ